MNQKQSDIQNKGETKRTNMNLSADVSA